ncbi:MULTISPECIES: rhodanese-like domain-containing protein [unclassified Actinotalea]|uniref:rhodanese-like domain-containing protein n=1 Tax=unclassified Actinotalea TaxID=2638618 RepID=UPI0015F666E7|nr:MULTISPECIES: rhodanese-like domain-containing protein [unclassified Actinotalea]
MREIDVTTLQQALADDAEATVVDVREVHEFESGHVPGAVNVPLSEFVERAGEVTSLEGEVYVICESGGRSGQVAAWLGQQGHDVVNVAGGTGAWRAAGRPVE